MTYESVPLLGEQKKTLSLWKFIFLSYFCVCGGPYGLELAIGTGYPAITLALLLIIPWVWSLPMALVTAEMSSSMPDNDGIVLWLKTAFGPYWGFVGAILSWFNYVVDNASYPVLFMSYLYHTTKAYAFIHNPYYFYGIQFGIVVGVTVLNLMGVDIVGSASSFFALLLLSPFFVLAAWALQANMINPADWIILPPTLDMGNLFVSVNIIIWSYSGYETLGQIVEELRDPKRNFSKAMFILVGLSIMTYLVAFFGAVSLDDDYSHWEQGYYAVLAAKLGGRPFKIVMMIAAMTSCVGIYNALMCTSSQELRALGKPDMLGSRLLRWNHPWFKTPWVAILFNGICIGALTLFPFDQLITVNNLIYSALMLLIYAACIRLRYTHKELHRPYKISNNIGTIFLCIPPCLLCLYIIVSSLIHSWMQFAIAFGVYVAASVLFGILYLCRRERKARKS